MKKRNWLYWGVLWVALILSSREVVDTDNAGVAVTALILWVILGLRVYSYLSSKEMKGWWEK